MKQHSQITVAVLPFSPVLSANISENGALKFGEFEGKFLQVVLDSFGTDYNVVVPEDKLFGGLLPNGSWTGMVGMVQRGEADLAFTYLSVTEERFKVVNFSTVYTIDALTFIAVMPEDIKSSFAFLHPFEITTWVAVFVILSLMTVLFTKFHERKFGILKSFFKLFANFCKQDSMPEDNSLKYKFLLIVWLFFATVITLSYSATLLSFIVRPTKDTMIRTFRELSKAVQNGTHKALFLNFSLPFLLGSQDDDLIALGEIVLSKKWFVDPFEQGRNSSIKSHTVQAMNRNFGTLLYGKRRDIYLAEDTLYLDPMAFAYGKNFCCPSKLNSILLRMSAAGLYEKQLRDSSQKYFLKTTRTSESSSPDSSLSMSDLLGAFMLFSVGIALSIGVFLGEMCHVVLHFVRK